MRYEDAFHFAPLGIKSYVLKRLISFKGSNFLLEMIVHCSLLGSHSFGLGNPSGSAS